MGGNKQIVGSDHRAKRLYVRANLRIMQTHLIRKIAGLAVTKPVQRSATNQDYSFKNKAREESLKRGRTPGQANHLTITAVPGDVLQLQKFDGYSIEIIDGY